MFTFCTCFTENLALHRPAWQSSTWVNTVYCCEKQIKKSYTAELAVDGKDTDLAWDGGQCAASDIWKTTAEWRVDLGGVRSIHHIVIQYATDNKVWGTVCFNVYNNVIYLC